MKKINLAGAAWSWVGATLAESAAIYRALGINALDLIAIPGTRLDTHQIAADPLGHARQALELGATLSNLLMFFGTSFCDRPVNSPDRTVRDKNLDTFQRVIEYCAAAKVYSVTVLPGVQSQGQSRADALQCAATELNRLTEVAKAAGVMLVYEPHVESILENPSDVVVFSRENTELRLVLDYSHGISAGYSIADLEPLIPYAGHVHLRQAAPGKIQARWEEGAIDFPGLMSQLVQSKYQGFATLEYEHDKFWNMDQCDVMTETIKMRNAVLPYLADS